MAPGGRVDRRDCRSCARIAGNGRSRQSPEGPRPVRSPDRRWCGPDDRPVRGSRSRFGVAAPSSALSARHHESGARRPRPPLGPPRLFGHVGDCLDADDMQGGRILLCDIECQCERPERGIGAVVGMENLAEHKRLPTYSAPPAACRTGAVFANTCSGSAFGSRWCGR
jgi:hypothetical protein